MNISTPSGQIDTEAALEYFRTQLPQDLERLLLLRDEIAKRQGAIQAVDAAHAMRAEAEAKLKAAQDEFNTVTTALRAKQKAVDAKLEELAQREAALLEHIQQTDADYAKREEVIADRETKLTAEEQRLVFQSNQLDAIRQQLSQSEAALEARIKAFKEHVASLAV